MFKVIRVSRLFLFFMLCRSESLLAQNTLVKSVIVDEVTKVPLQASIYKVSSPGFTRKYYKTDSTGVIRYLCSQDFKTKVYPVDTIRYYNKTIDCRKDNREIGLISKYRLAAIKNAVDSIGKYSSSKSRDFVYGYSLLSSFYEDIDSLPAARRYKFLAYEKLSDYYGIKKGVIGDSHQFALSNSLKTKIQGLKKDFAISSFASNSYDSTLTINLALIVDSFRTANKFVDALADNTIENTNTNNSIHVSFLRSRAKSAITNLEDNIDSLSEDLSFDKLASASSRIYNALESIDDPYQLVSIESYFKKTNDFVTNSPTISEKKRVADFVTLDLQLKFELHTDQGALQGQVEFVRQKMVRVNLNISKPNPGRQEYTLFWGTYFGSELSDTNQHNQWTGRIEVKQRASFLILPVPSNISFWIMENKTKVINRAQSKFFPVTSETTELNLNFANQ